MAKLTAKRRKALPKSKFASPKGKGGKGMKRGKNQYPVDTRARAANAKARATQQYRKGRISKSTRDAIHAKANRKLRK